MISTSSRLASLVLGAIVVVAGCTNTGANTSAPATGGAASQPASSQGTGDPQVPRGAVALQGAGATFPAPLYENWFQEFKGAQPNVKINYQAIGSGGGIKAITERTVDFGASDAPDEGRARSTAAAGKMLHIPTALGAVVLIYNLPDVTPSSSSTGPTHRRHLSWARSRSGTTPRSRPTTPGVTLPRPGHHRRPPLRRLGHDERLHDYLDTVSARVEDEGRRGQGGQVADRHRAARATTASPARSSRRPGAIGYVELNYATAEQADARPRSRTRTASSSRPRPRRHRRRRGRRGTTSRPTSAQLRSSTAPATTTYPIAVVHLPARLPGPDRRGQGPGPRRLPLLGADRRPGDAKRRSGYAPLPDEVQQKALTSSTWSRPAARRSGPECRSAHPDVAGAPDRDRGAPHRLERSTLDAVQAGAMTDLTLSRDLAGHRALAIALPCSSGSRRGRRRAADR